MKGVLIVSIISYNAVVLVQESSVAVADREDMALLLLTDDRSRDGW